MFEDPQLSALVQETYTQIADKPTAAPFPTGRKLAEDLGYPKVLLDGLPQVAVEAFCGIANLWKWIDIKSRDQVLDLGCGAGLDTILAARQARQVCAVDFSESMLRRNQEAVAEAGLSNKVLHFPAEAHRLPLLDRSFDVALVNGIFNLNPNREQIFEELGRLLRPGGSLYAAELILKDDAPIPEDEPNWVS